MRISRLIRQAAKAKGLGVETFRRAAKIPNTTFYALLRDELPKKTATLRLLRRRLAAAGVPEDEMLST